MNLLEELEEELQAWTAGTDLEACAKRAQILRVAHTSIANYLEAKDSLTASKWLEKIANSSRQPNWRNPIGESGLLTAMIASLDLPDVVPQLKIQTLRLTGNSCADTNFNRALIVNCSLIPTLTARIQDPSLATYVVTVLFNLCNDFEPAQKAVSRAGFTTSVHTLLSGPSAINVEQFIPLLARLISLLTTHDCETESASVDFPSVLFSYALHEDIQNDLDDFISVVSAAWSYLATPRFQTGLLRNPEGMLTYLNIIWTANSRWDLNSTEEDPELLSILKSTRCALISTLADITGLDDFLAAYPLGSPVFDTLKSWISPKNPVDISSAACIALGNLARSDTNTVAMVKVHEMHLSLVSILADPSITDSLLLHATFGFLRNLSLPPENKKIIGASGIFNQDVLPRIWEIDVNPQIQYAAVALTRILLVGTRENFNALYDLQKSTEQNAGSDGWTNIQHLMDVGERSDAEPTKMEAARSIGAICRMLHTDPAVNTSTSKELEDACSTGNDTVVTKSDSENVKTRRSAFYEAHPKITVPLTQLVTQTKYAVIRSEAWFVFALMARSDDGVQVVIRILQDDKAFEALAETISGEKKMIEEITESLASAQVVDPSTLLTGLPTEPQAPQGPQPPVKIDRENAVVLVDNVLKKLNTMAADEGEVASLKVKLSELHTRGINLLHSQ